VTGALVIGAGLGLLAALAAGYWLVVVAEGAYLGPGLVRRLYDRGAETYDAVKRFDSHDEAAQLANPLLERLEASAPPAPLVLDLATGTGRLPVVLLRTPWFRGHVVGVDVAGEMLRRAAAATSAWRDRCHLWLGEADQVPFADDAFDAVSMLEALELMPRRDRALAEAVRVLAPGGWLLVSNRIGIDRFLLPGRVDAPAAFEGRLRALGMVDVVTEAWQSYYDLVWCRKPVAPSAPGRPGSESSHRAWHTNLVCAVCGARGAWMPGDGRLTCGSCHHSLERVDGVWRPVEHGAAPG
jgi:ubiquinone/menaquinone biosynthesis C-methylase UbiE